VASQPSLPCNINPSPFNPGGLNVHLGVSHRDSCVCSVLRTTGTYCTLVSSHLHTPPRFRHHICQCVSFPRVNGFANLQDCRIRSVECRVNHLLSVETVLPADHLGKIEFALEVIFELGEVGDQVVSGGDEGLFGRDLTVGLDAELEFGEERVWDLLVSVSS
jgi:hypothetical protein